MMKQQTHNQTIYFQFDSFLAKGQAEHAVFSRHHGRSPAPFHSLNLSISVADDPTHVMANRQQAYGVFGRDHHTVVQAHLVHGNNVTPVSQANNGQYTPECDGLITNQSGCALAMNFADCAPIFLYDPIKQAIGLGHAGWKGAVVDLPGAMVRAMQHTFGTTPTDLFAGIGPCIGWEEYEVDEPLVGDVQAAFADWPRFLRKPATNAHGRYHFDLAAANQHRLQAAGVRHIELSGFSTAARTDLFFSHRAEKGKTGRFGAIFILTG